MLWHAGEEEDALRHMYKTEFEANEQMVAWVTGDANHRARPRKRTKTQAIADGNAVLNRDASRADSAFYDVDLHTQMLWYHNKILHSLYDLAHEFANIIKQSFNFMKNTNKKGKVKFSATQRELEVQRMRRFPDLALVVDEKGVTKTPVPPWVVSKSGQEAVDGLPAVCKTPIGWPAYRKMFQDLGFAKTSETTLFAGDVGAYTLRHADLAPDIRDLFIEMYRIIERYKLACLYCHTTSNRTHVS